MTTRKDSCGSGAAKTDEKYKNGGKDLVKGKPVTKETNEGAKKGAQGFKIAEKLKHIEFERGPKY